MNKNSNKDLAGGLSIFDIVNHLSGAIMITDQNGTITYVNPQFTKLFGYSTREIIGKKPSKLQSTKHDHYYYADFWNKLIKEGSWEGEMWNKQKNGDINPFWLSVNAHKNEHGMIQHFIALYQDLSKRKIIESDMKTLAYSDSLTGLPNRRSFKSYIEKELEEAKKSKALVGVLFLDLNRFKDINDTLGHHIGDIILIEVANRLKEAVRSTDIVARMGGDEFTILLPHIQDSANVTIVCNKIFKKMEAPFHLEGKDYKISLSIGVSIFPYDGITSGELMQKADLAMYRAKNDGGGFCLYIEDISNEGRDRLELENDLRKALEQNEFELHYQPQMDVSNDESATLMGVEALLRWRHPIRGFISPAVFIPMAEDLGLIPAIGRWVLHTACRQNKKWQSKGYTPIVMAVNLSPKQFQKKDVLDIVTDVLKKTKLDPHYLELELTESGIMDKPDYVIETLTELKRLGVRVAIDDFGTGYSSLSHLKRFPIDFLKIDRSFISDIYNGGEPISTAIIDMARNLQMGVIAEGVENKEQLEFLKKNGCIYMQGYYFGRPMPPDDVENMMQKPK